MTADDFRTLRDRQARIEAEVGRGRGLPGARVDRQLVKVYDAGKIPTSPNFMFACNPVQLDCPEQAGASCTEVVDTATTLYVDFVQNAPVAGDMAVARLVGGRWVARKGRGRPKCTDWLCGPIVTIAEPPVLGGTCGPALATVQVNPDGTLGNLKITQAGSCYDSNPAVTISAPINGGTRATATATVGAVTGLSLGNVGVGYTVAPPVTIAAPGGSGTTATATATVNPDGSLSLTLTDGGSLYTDANPVVTIGPPPAGGKQATATATAQPGVVTSLKLTNPGSGYNVSNSVPTGFDLTITGPNGPTIGPIRLTSGGTYQGAPVNQSYCAWSGAGKFDVPATSACPGLTGVGVSAELVFTSTGGYQVLIDFGVQQPLPIVTPVNCPAPYGSGATMGCLVKGGAAQWPWSPPSCTARPYSGSQTVNFYPATASVSYGSAGPTVYLIFGGTCPGDGSSPQPGIPVTFTLTEVD